MRKTKIICTIGPASENEETLKKMCLAGMNVARLNFSHGTHEEQQKKIDLIKKVRTELNLPIAILLDTKGPEYRIRTFKDGKVHGMPAINSPSPLTRWRVTKKEYPSIIRAW